MPPEPSLSLNELYLKSLEKKPDHWTRLKVSYVTDYINDSTGKAKPSYCNLKQFNITKTLDNQNVLNRVTHDYGFTNILKFVPCVEAFSIIWEAHIADNVHRTFIETVRIIRAEYFVELHSIKSVLDLCTYCKTLKHAEKLNDRCTVSVINMTEKPDQDFKYILVYEDLYTGLIQLRPLVNQNDTEVSLELLKIFTDFGPPNELLLSFFSDSLYTLDKCSEYLKAVRIQFKYRRAATRWLKHIVMLMDMLMFDLNVTDWAMLCYTLQWRINNSQFCMMSAHNLTFKNKFFEEGFSKQRPSENVTEITNLLKLDLDSEDEFSSFSHTDDSDIEILDIEDNVTKITPVIPGKKTVDKCPIFRGKKDHKKICVKCKKDIASKFYRCSKCSCFLHLYCGTRVTCKEKKSVILICNVCHNNM